MRRSCTLGILLLLITVAQVAAQSDLTDSLGPSAAMTRVRCHVVTAPPVHATGLGVARGAVPSSRAEFRLPNPVPRVDASFPFSLLCVLRC